MINYPTLVLKPNRSESLKRKHPWVFSGAIQKLIIEDDREEVIEGDLVRVVDSKEKFLGIGHFAGGSISVRVISFKEVPIDEKFWINKIANAYQLRNQLHLANSEQTTTFRLIHAEGDGLPGLIIDVYNKTAIIQAHSVGMAKSLHEITEGLKKVMNDHLEAVYSKSEKTVHVSSENITEDGLLLGQSNSPQIVLENYLKFEIDWVDGQKTGFFIDQRENRKLLQHYSKNKKVLNTFCYSGGFSVYALAAGAKLVRSVDSSAKAIQLTDKNVLINFGEIGHHTSFTQDTLKFLKQTDEKYDTIILDPPAYAKSKNAQHKAVQGYKRLNEVALKLINKGGILFTFSCSQTVGRQLFENTIMAAAIAANRTVKVLHHLSQPADHPVSIFHPEGEYLKGMVLYIEE